MDGLSGMFGAPQGPLAAGRLGELVFESVNVTSGRNYGVSIRISACSVRYQGCLPR
jgi:hypothetical protein